MPEGQVSHRNAIRFTAALVGVPLVRVEAPGPRLAGSRIPERLAGDMVTAAEAVGKHHLLRFASGRVLHSHLQMNGVWRLAPAGRPLRRGGLDLALHTERHVATLYRCSRVKLFEPGERLPRDLVGIGPDLVGEGVDPGEAAVAALSACEPGRQVGDALMDQRLVSGIGNVYKSETCFLAGIDPWRAVGSLTADEARLLGETAARLIADDVRSGGRIRTYRPAGAPPWSRESKWVYGRLRKPCRRCGTPVRSRGQGDANRTTYWCPGCQR